jgi:hypothetical protein
MAAGDLTEKNPMIIIEQGKFGKRLVKASPADIAAGIKAGELVRHNSQVYLRSQGRKDMVARRAPVQPTPAPVSDEGDEAEGSDGTYETKEVTAARRGRPRKI